MVKQQGQWQRRMIGVLLPAGPRPVALDEIGEAIGTESVSADQVEALIDALIAEGATIAEGEVDGLAPLLRQVIQCAHDLRSEGKRPSPTNIAQESGLSARAVRVALLYAHVLQG